MFSKYNHFPLKQEQQNYNFPNESLLYLVAHKSTRKSACTHNIMVLLYLNYYLFPSSLMISEYFFKNPQVSSYFTRTQYAKLNK